MTYLQHLWRKHRWLIYYRLHRLPYNTVKDLNLTVSASKAVAEYNGAVDRLSKELRLSYECNKVIHKLDKKVLQASTKGEEK